MKTMGWTLAALGLLGALACLYGIVASNQATGRAQEAAASLGTEARALLDLVDGKLAGLPAQVTELVERKEEGELERRLGALEDALGDAHETGGTILSLLEVASRLRGRGAVADEFPNVVALHGGLGEAHRIVREQRADMATWTLRAVALNGLIETAREEVAATRAQTERIETRTVDLLGTLALLASVFLVWMGVGQVALALLGRAKATAGAAEA